MAIDREEVKHIAHLAMLGVSDAEIDHLAEELTALLDYFAILSEKDVNEFDPYVGSSDKCAPERKDTPGHSLSNEEALREAPDSADGHFRLPRIVD